MITAFLRLNPSSLLLPLIRTLLDIALLRKGPEDLPASGVLLFLSVVLSVLSSLAALTLIDRFDEDDFFLGLFSGLVGLSCYAGILFLSGKSARMLQTLSAIVGTGALIVFAFVAEYVLLTPVLGSATSGLIATVILLWSVPVEGHIIARAVDRHWYIGLVLAVGVFIVQYAINLIISAEP
jgi:hypothetical protein